MADEPQDTVSREAHERMTRERDELKARLADLENVARDVSFRDRAYETFREMGAPDPYGLASRAVRDVTLKDKDGEDFRPALESWYQDLTAMFGTAATAQAGNAPTETAEPPKAPQPRSPFGHNPAAPGTPTDTQPKSLRSDEYRQWKVGKTLAEQVEAVKSGRFAVPEDVRRMQEASGKALF